MNSKLIVHFLFALTSVTCGVLLTARILSLELIPSSEPINLLLMDQQGCSSSMAKNTTPANVTQASRNSWNCPSNPNIPEYAQRANSSIGGLSDNFSNAAAAQPPSGSTRSLNFLLHLTIAISIVVLMFRTQAMEWELLQSTRTVDVS